jgi:hypothetical protein
LKAFLTRAGTVLVGLLLGAAVIYALLPRARAREDRQKLEAARATCQVLLIGPSYANMVQPNVFNAEARRIGPGKQLCKLGRAGLAAFELAQDVDFALTGPWPKLELVLIDVTLGPKPAFPEGNWFKTRTVEWHSLAGLKWVTASYRDRQSKPPSLRVWLSHVEHFLAHYVSLGRAPELFGWREPLKVLTTGRVKRAKPKEAKEAKEAKTAERANPPRGDASDSEDAQRAKAAKSAKAG